MNRFYSRFRVMLLTFTFGLAVVPFYNALYEKWSEIPVNLPEAKSESPIVIDIYPTKRFPMKYYGGGSAGCGRDLNFRSDGRFEKSIGRKAEHIPKKKSLKSRRDAK